VVRPRILRLSAIFRMGFNSWKQNCVTLRKLVFAFAAFLLLYLAQSNG
jgi:hypothetical protein